MSLYLEEGIIQMLYKRMKGTVYILFGVLSGEQDIPESVTSHFVKVRLHTLTRNLQPTVFISPLSFIFNQLLIYKNIVLLFMLYIISCSSAILQQI